MNAGSADTLSKIIAAAYAIQVGLMGGNYQACLAELEIGVFA